MKEKLRMIRWQDVCAAVLVCVCAYEFRQDYRTLHLLRPAPLVQAAAGVLLLWAGRKFAALSKPLPRGSQMLFLLLAPALVLTVVCGEFTTKIGYLRYAYCVMLAVELLGGIITGRNTAAALFCAAVLGALLAVNDVVLQLTGNVFLAADIFSAGTALSVAAEYWKQLRPSADLLGAVLGGILLWKLCRAEVLRQMKGMPDKPETAHRGD